MEKPPQTSTNLSENSPDNFRQQNKIIKIIESGNPDMLNSPLAAVSADERDSFLKKITEGVLTDEDLDAKVVREIGSPFSGENGIKNLRENLQGTGSLEEFLSVARSIMNPGGRRREGGIPTALIENEMQGFLNQFSTPRAFDDGVIGDRLQELETAYSTEQNPNKRENLKMEIAIQKQMEREVYPRIKAAVYGKRNEYWEQIKLLKKEAAGRESDEGDEKSGEAKVSEKEVRKAELAEQSRLQSEKDSAEAAGLLEKLQGGVTNEEVDNTHGEALRMNKIRDYEKANGVTQDVIAQSYLAHVDIYKRLSEESTEAMNRYLRLEELIVRDSPLTEMRDNPSVIEAKKEWDDAVAKTEREYKIMNPMVEHLTPETLAKYRKDFELRGAVNPNY